MPDMDVDFGATSKSYRVCLNCRRKKKRCDKALPSCGRCTESLETCQHEEPESPKSSSGSDRTAVASVSRVKIFDGQSPDFKAHIGSTLLSAFETYTTDMDVFTYSMLMSMVGDVHQIELATHSYFRGINTWFSIVEEASYRRQLNEMWAKPSAETSLLTMGIYLATRSPITTGATDMMSPAYMTAKSAMALAQTKNPYSIVLLQANLLFALYEHSHGMVEPAFLTMGTVIRITQALGWHNPAFWADQNIKQMPCQMKLCSILWWATVFMDIFVRFDCVQDTGNGFDYLAPGVPLPEEFDELTGVTNALTRHRSSTLRNPEMANILTMVWPEARSIKLLSRVIAYLKSAEQNPGLETERMHTELLDYMSSIMVVSHRFGDHCAALAINMIALFMLHGRVLGDEPINELTQPAEAKQVEVLASVTLALFEILSTFNAMNVLPWMELMPPACAFHAKQQTIILIRYHRFFGDTNWLTKVQTNRKYLETMGMRWKIAEKHSKQVDQAFDIYLASLNASSTFAAGVPNAGVSMNVPT